MNSFPLPLHLRDIPADLQCAVIWIVFTVATVYLPVINETPLRVLFALPFILFIPGYLLIAALFPKQDDLDGIERVALSFGLSIAIVPLIGLALNYTPWGIRLDPILTALALFTFGMAGVALYRRLLVLEEERFTVAFGAGVAQIRSELFDADASRLDRLLSVLLLLAITAAVVTTAYVIVVPKEGEKFTEFYILGMEGKAADYPTLFSEGESQSLIIGIGNHEYRYVNYTVETYLMDQTFDPATNQSTIHAMELLDRFMVEIDHNETEEIPYTFTVEDDRYNRLQLLLFCENPPAEEGEERIATAYRDLHLWIDVRSGDR